MIAMLIEQCSPAFSSQQILQYEYNIFRVFKANIMHYSVGTFCEHAHQRPVVMCQCRLDVCSMPRCVLCTEIGDRVLLSPQVKPVFLTTYLAYVYHW